MGLLDERGTITRAEAKDPPEDDAGQVKRRRFFGLVAEVNRVAERGQLRTRPSTTAARHAVVDELAKLTRVSAEDLGPAVDSELTDSARELARLDRFALTLTDRKPPTCTDRPAEPCVLTRALAAEYSCGAMPISTCSPRAMGSTCSLETTAISCLSMAHDLRDPSTLGDATQAVSSWAKSRRAS